MSANAQEPVTSQDSGTAQAQIADEQAIGVIEQFEWSASPPTLTAEQLTSLEYWTENTHLPGPVLDQASQDLAAGPVPGTESDTEEERIRSGVPLVPGDHSTYQGVGFWSQISGSASSSNVLEASVGAGGRYVFYTGNWFSARSTDGGITWSYVSPYSGFSDFCCDQLAEYDVARNKHLWLRQGVASTNPGTGNYENVFKLGVSTTWSASSFCTYSFSPTSTNAAWTNQWWDYPHWQLGADYLWLTFNMFDQGDSYTRSVILKFPLDALATCSGFGYSYYDASDWFTWTPVSGADHIMYWASNWPNTTPQNSRLRIYKWEESSGSLSWVTRNLAAWTFTNRGTATCGSTSGDWADRLDQRVMTGARYRIQNTDVMTTGQNVLGWWWNVAQGGGFSQPYTEGAAFYEDTLTQVGGTDGRPYIFNSVYCYLYPSAAPNTRGDLGILLHRSSNSTNHYPDVRVTYSDDYVAGPPGWTTYPVATSLARPSDNKWGDYNTLRTFVPSGLGWTGASHTIRNISNCSNCGRPWFGAFGRERDYFSWRRWYFK